ncbi:ComEC/Rec2 family competence protein [Candidatus Microgenomates bacterium]|nr:ComEC/Rec2 family competence protein [Candidatus Microgenomates bacterium]
MAVRQIQSLRRLFWNHTRLLEAAAIGFLAGLLLARWGIEINRDVIGLSLLLVILAWRYHAHWLLVGCLLLNVGIWRGQLTILSFQPLQTHIGQEVMVTGRINDDPAFTQRRQSEFHLDYLALYEFDRWQRVAGKLTVRGFADNKVGRHDIVTLTGRLQPTIGSSQGRISFAKITVQSHDSSGLENLRQRFLAGTRTALAEPAASLGLGFLVGTRSLLPDSLLDQLSLIGLTHIVAVSGYNLTILVRFTRRLFARVSKYLAAVSSWGLIFVFLAITGLSPSVFRAAVVSVLALAAWYYGRPVKPMVLIWLAAALTAAVNPVNLWADIGWHLSFLAFVGVMVLAPALSRRLFHERRPSTIGQLLIETFSAQLLTWPLIALVFGQVSLMAPLANLLILPLIPLAMLLSFIAGLSGMWLPAVVGWFAWPAQLLLTGMVELVEWFSDWSFAGIQVSVTTMQLVFVYGLMLLVIVALRRAVGPELRPANVLD